MSNSYQKIYEQGILNLARSLIIKSEATADAVNQQILRESVATGRTVLLQQPETWRYYRNIAGLYHETDVPMTVISLDTAEEISFDKVTLVDHRATVRTYSQYGTFYRNLVKRYPEQEQLIRGILNPVDIQTAITAPDHTILAWDTTLVESQEDDLIYTLQVRIQKWFKRWYNHDFRLAHPVYPATALAVGLAYVPSFIKAIRLENCHTPKVHTFHIWQFLDNFGDFSKYRRVLTIKQALWLYRNIRWLRNNAGQKVAFDASLKAILTERLIPLGQYVAHQNVEDIVDDLYPKPVMQRRPLNDLDYNPLSIRTRSVSELTELQIPLARDNQQDLDTVKTLTTKEFSRTGFTTLPTKVLESEMADNTQRKPYALSDVLLKHWIFYATSGRYSSVITVRNPNNGDSTRMSSREAVVWWIYGMNRIFGVDLLNSPVPKLTVEFVRKRVPPTREELRYSVSRQRISEADITECLADVFPIEQVISTETFYYLCSEIHSRMLRHYRQFTREDRSVKRGQLEFMTNLCYRTAECTLTETPQTFQQYFDERGWTLNELSDDDIRLTVESTLQLATGSDVAEVVTISQLQTLLLELMGQLTAYSNQYIATMNSGPALALHVTRSRLDNIKVELGVKSFAHQADITVKKLDASYDGHVKTDTNAASTVSIKRGPLSSRVRLETQMEITNKHWFEDRIFVPTSDTNIRKVTWSF